MNSYSEHAQCKLKDSVMRLFIYFVGNKTRQEQSQQTY